MREFKFSNEYIVHLFGNIGNQKVSRVIITGKDYNDYILHYHSSKLYQYIRQLIVDNKILIVEGYERDVNQIRSTGLTYNFISYDYANQMNFYAQRFKKATNIKFVFNSKLSNIFSPIYLIMWEEEKNNTDYYDKYIPVNITIIHLNSYKNEQKFNILIFRSTRIINFKKMNNKKTFSLCKKLFSSHTKNHKLSLLPDSQLLCSNLINIIQSCCRNIEDGEKILINSNFLDLLKNVIKIHAIFIFYPEGYELLILRQVLFEINETNVTNVNESCVKSPIRCLSKFKNPEKQNKIS